MPSHKLYKLFILSVIAGLVLAACASASTPAPAGSDLMGKTWLWQKTEFNDGKNIPVLSPDGYTLQFLDGGKISLKADCNTGGGSYTLANNVDLTIRVETLTQAMCPQGSLADEFVKELNDTGSYKIERTGELVLALATSGGGMRFKAQ